MDSLFIPFFVTFAVGRFHPHLSKPPFICCYFHLKASATIIWACACLMLELELSPLCLEHSEGAAWRTKVVESLAYSVSCQFRCRHESPPKPDIWLFCYLSIMSLTFPNPPCQHILMQHMDGGPIELLSVLLLIITFYPLFEMKAFPLTFPIFVPLQLLSCN